MSFKCIIIITYFNPRSPWGERPKTGKYFTNYDLFQSTLPVGGATNSNTLANIEA